ncbi:MAG: arylsulfotransferase family protein, partial [Desulfobacterales bacterium]
WVVRHTVAGGNKAGFVGEIAVTIASTPSNLKMLLNGPEDYISKGIISLYDLGMYKSVLENKTNGPKYFSKKGLSGLQPLAIQARINNRKDEIIAIFDSKRNLVKTIPIQVKSMLSHIPAKIGASPYHFFDDGSYLIWPYGGVGLFRLDSCGNIIWQQEGMYHHYFSIADGKLYILGLPSNDINKKDDQNWNHSDILNIIDVDTGEILRSTTIEEISLANLPNTDPLFYQQWQKSINDKGVLNHDFLHLNKIEVLPNSMRKQYPDLPAGALMVSARNINLIFIMDPETLRIIWHSHGNTQRQHEPKFIGDNKIAIFNNSYNGNHPNPNHKSNYSSIKTFDFKTQRWQTLYNAKPIKGYTEIQGKFDISTNNSLLLNLSLQGRIVELRRDGKPLFEFVSVCDGASVFWQKDAQYISQSTFDSLTSSRCN